MMSNSFFKGFEGAELCFYIDGNSNTLSLSNKQFYTILKILGISFTETSVSCYSDATLDKFMELKSNPLRMQEVD